MVPSRVAILLTGQMRRYTDPDVQHSLHSYFALFDAVDIFVSTWSDRGISYNHGDMRIHGDEGDAITEEKVRSAFPQTRSVVIHDLKAWEAKLEGCWRAVYTEGFQWNGGHIRGTAVPQLFTLWDANKARQTYQQEKGIQYDLVIRVRADALFIPHSRSLYERVLAGEIHAINNPTSGTYYPQRIYDIFFFGTPEAMDVACEAYPNLPQLVAHPWQNGLHPRDACRCLYVQTRFVGGLGVCDIPLDICKAKR
jgi:hypothetical protein